MPSTPHTTAAILSVGDELILGQTLDTNSKRLAEHLTARGVRVIEHTTVDDHLPQQAQAIARLAARADLLLCTGGLGPTADDLTRHALARVLDEPLIEDPAALADIRAFYTRRERPMPEPNRVQALRPASARMIRNEHGTAPGLFAVIPAPTPQRPAHTCDALFLPGPPRELMPMLEREFPLILRADPARSVSTRVLRTFGLGESVIAQMLGPLMDRARDPARDALVGTTASAGVVSIRLRAECPPQHAPAVLDRAEADVRAALGPIILDAASSSPLFSAAPASADPLALEVLAMLASRSHLLATAESCTGGLLGQLLTSIPNSSSVYLGGLITYHNDAKSRLAHVDRALIAAHGAVSAPVARAMARGTLDALPADHALAITGIAGPAGGSEDKPVGTVWIARATRAATPFPDETRRFRFAGDRDTIRDMAAKSALGMLRQHLLAARSPSTPRTISPTPAFPPLIAEVERLT